jgi:hypothetical protein
MTRGVPTWQRLSGQELEGPINTTAMWMTTIGVSEQRVTLWTLRDFRVERAIPRGPYRSLTIKRQYDCSQRKSRPLHTRYYPDGMAQGLVLYAAPATREWSRVVSGSDDDAEMKVACRQAHRG